MRTQIKRFIIMTNKGDRNITGHVSEFNFKEDDFSVWIEHFELYILLNEINEHKKKNMFLTLGNEGYSLFVIYAHHENQVTSHMMC